MGCVAICFRVLYSYKVQWLSDVITSVTLEICKTGFFENTGYLYSEVVGKGNVG